MGCQGSKDPNSSVLPSQEKGAPSPGQQPSSVQRISTNEFGPQPTVTEEDMANENAKIQAAAGRSRRAGVAAESVDAGTIKDYKKPVYPKDDATKNRIRATLKENEKLQVLFGHLDGEPLNDVINAFYDKEVKEGQDIIRQGDEGDCLYIVNEGSVDIFVARPGADGKIAAGDRGAKVVSFGAGALFGELALMYNTPRAATVVAASSAVTLWVLSAMDFKMLLAQSSQAQYAKYEGWLSRVELLSTLNHFELSKLADCLENETFDKNEVIIKQGDVGEKFYILEDGEAAAFITGADGEKEVKQYRTQGEYFGEIALLTDASRKATIRATGKGCAVVSLCKADFDSLLGPIAEKLKQHVDKYPQYADFLK